jgi:hypothetical protein
MKNIKNIIALLLFIAIGIAAGCKKDPVMYAKGIETFKFIVKDAQGADKEYPGTIAGDEIVVNLPIEVDVTDLKASFTVDNPRTIVQVGSVVQESGISEQDFTNPIAYKVKAEDRSTRSYAVRVEKKIALKSFGFFAEDNPGLQGNFPGVIRGLNIDMPIAETANLSSLVARFETTTGAVLKVGATTQESKKTTNDFTNTVVYSYNDPNLPAALNYNINISFIGRQWTLIGDNLTIPTASAIKMSINPINNYPAFIYQRTGKDENGVALPNDKKDIAVMSYNGTEWQYLGPKTGITEVRAEVPAIAFNQEGTPYIAYKDYLNNEQKGTVLKYNGATWSGVGSNNFTPVKVDYLSLTIGPDNNPTIAMAKNGTDASGIIARGLYVTSYKNSTWTNNTPPGGVVVFYDQIITGLDGKMYVGVMDRTTGVNKPSLFVNNNNQWTAVGPTSFTAPDAMVGFQMVSVAVDKTGQAYLAYGIAPSSGRATHIMKFNKATSTWQELGTAVSAGGEKDKFVLAVDQEGVLYFAYANASSVSVRTFNNATNNWNADRKVIREKVNEFDMQIAPDGTAYLVASIPVTSPTGSNSKTVVYKYAK